jgi:hypothetical protein
VLLAAIPAGAQVDVVFANYSEGGVWNTVCLNDGTGAFTCSDVSTDTNGSTEVALAFRPPTGSGGFISVSIWSLVPPITWEPSLCRTSGVGGVRSVATAMPRDLITVRDEGGVA